MESLLGRHRGTVGITAGQVKREEESGGVKDADAAANMKVQAQTDIENKTN